MGKTPGVPIARAIADHLVKVQLAVKGATQGRDVQTAMHVVQLFHQRKESELRQVAAGLLANMADDPELPPEIRTTVQELVKGRGAFLGTVLEIMVGVAIGFGASSVFTPYFQGTLNQLQAHYSTVPLPAGEVAGAVARGLWEYEQGREEARLTGIGTGRWDVLVGLAMAFPGTGQVLELLDRGTIDRATARDYLHRQGFGLQQADQLLALSEALLAPADLALGVLRGNVPEARAYQEAAQSGVSRDRFDVLVANTGEPIALEELLAAFRRGIIDQGRLDRGIRQSRVRNEWTDVVHALRYVPMTPGQAIQALVEGHLPESTARRKAQEGGLLPEDFDPLFEIAGNPPGMQDILELWNRGEVPEQVVDQAYRESRYKPKYLELYKKLHRRLPPQRTVVSMVAQGVITAEGAVAKLMDLGYSRADAEILVQEGVARKTATTRDLAKSEVLALFQAREITEQRADGMLRDLGYDQSEASLLLALTEHSRERRYREAVVERVHSAYVQRKVEEPRVRNVLSRDGIAGDQVTEYLTLWDLEREAIPTAPSSPEHPELTTAQLQQLVRRGVIDETEFLARVGRKGFAPAEAHDLLILAFPESRQKDLTTAQVQALLRRGAVDLSEFGRRLAEAGYTESDITFLALLAFPAGPPGGGGA